MLDLFRGCKEISFGGHFFHFYEVKLFFIDVAMCDTAHDVETIHGLCSLLTESGNIF